MNGGLSPSDVSAGSHKVVWWNCPWNPKHVFDMKVYARVSSCNGCPFCTGHRTHYDDSLLARYPEIAAEWHQNLNAKLKASDVRPHSNKLVWWKGAKCGHFWNEAITARTTNNSGCPMCSGHRFCAENSLPIRYPELMYEWDGGANQGIDPAALHHGTALIVGWICKKKHRWSASVANRAKNGSGCPFCCNSKVCKDNCLATTHPKLSQEWHQAKNGKLTPNDVVAGTSKKVWWKCNVNPEHHWRASIVKRANLGRGCPECCESRGERTIRRWLVENEVEFESQHWFEDCRAVYPLPFDFYLPKHGCCIEYDGENHYRDSRWFERKDIPYEMLLSGFEATQRNDLIKTNYCLSNKIRLVRIPYWDIGRIEEILNKELK